MSLYNAKNIFNDLKKYMKNEKIIKMEGNRICRQIDWYENEDHVQAWREGRTGYPWIDAMTRQMVKEGL